MPDGPIARTTNAARYLARKARLYTGALGPAGLLPFAAIHLGRRFMPQRADGCVLVRVPGVRTPIALRRGTTDVGTFEHLFFTDQYAPRLYADLRPRVIVDCGANIGLATLQLANRYPQARIAALEPERSNFELLCRNVAAYPYVKPIHAAVWSRVTTLEIEDRSIGKDAFQVREAHAPGSDGIPATTIPDVLRDLGEDHIDILKIDIEGSESDLFAAGAVDWLDRVRVLIIELHEWLLPGSSQTFEAALDGRPFARHHVGENDILIATGVS